MRKEIIALMAIAVVLNGVAAFGGGGSFSAPAPTVETPAAPVVNPTTAMGAHDMNTAANMDTNMNTETRTDHGAMTTNTQGTHESSASMTHTSTHSNSGNMDNFVPTETTDSGATHTQDQRPPTTDMNGSGVTPHSSTGRPEGQMEGSTGATPTATMTHTTHTTTSTGSTSGSVVTDAERRGVVIEDKPNGKSAHRMCFQYNMGDTTFTQYECKDDDKKQMLKDAVHNPYKPKDDQRVDVDTSIRNNGMEVPYVAGETRPTTDPMIVGGNPGTQSPTPTTDVRPTPTPTTEPMVGSNPLTWGPRMNSDGKQEWVKEDPNNPGQALYKYNTVTMRDEVVYEVRGEASASTHGTVQAGAHGSTHTTTPQGTHTESGMGSTMAGRTDILSDTNQQSGSGSSTMTTRTNEDGSVTTTNQHNVQGSSQTSSDFNGGTRTDAAGHMNTEGSTTASSTVNFNDADPNSVRPADVASGMENTNMNTPSGGSGMNTDTMANAGNTMTNTMHNAGNAMQPGQSHTAEGSTSGSGQADLGTIGGQQVSVEGEGHAQGRAEVESFDANNSDDQEKITAGIQGAAQGEVRGSATLNVGDESVTVSGNQAGSVGGHAIGQTGNSVPETVPTTDTTRPPETVTPPVVETPVPVPQVAAPSPSSFSGGGGW